MAAAIRRLRRLRQALWEQAGVSVLGLSRPVLRRASPLGMKPVSSDARQLAEVFTREGLAKLDAALESQPWARELREAALNWIEHHTERKLATRELLETP